MNRGFGIHCTVEKIYEKKVIVNSGTSGLGLLTTAFEAGRD